LLGVGGGGGEQAGEKEEADEGSHVVVWLLNEGRCVN
jgi:hypothetical protein